MPTLPRLALLVLIASVAGACGQEPDAAVAGPGSPCDRDEECTGDEVCNTVLSVCERPSSPSFGDAGPSDAGPVDASAAAAADVPGANEQPFVVSIDPADGARGLDPDQDRVLTIVFSEPVQRTKVEAGVFLDEIGGDRVPLAITYDDATLTATARPDRPLAPWGIYRLQVSTEIKDNDDPPRNLREKDVRFSMGGAADATEHFAARALEYAPIVYQDTASKVKKDYLTAFDFDGTWVATDRAENSQRRDADLKAVVYYSVIQSKTHTFIAYAFYHPQDIDITTDAVRRENSLKGAVVVVGNDGAVRLVETYSHEGDDIEPFQVAGAGYRLRQGVGNRELVEMPESWFEDGKRYQAFITEQRHDSCIWGQDRSGGLSLPFCRHEARTFRQGNGVKYVPAAAGQKPNLAIDNGCDQDCDAGEQCRADACHATPYELRSILGSFWVRRISFPATGEAIWPEASEFGYEPPPGRPGESLRLPSVFAGDSGDETNSGRPPWAWLDREARSIPRGAWFLDPAWALAQRFTPPDGESWSQDYCWNPFFGIDNRGTEGCGD